MASKRYKFHVNTSSFCFLCSDKILNNKTSSDGDSFSLKHIFRYLDIKLNKIEILSAKPTELLNRTDVRVSLCDKCQKTFEEISNLYRTMEVIKMKLDYNFETIQKVVISTSDVKVQNYQNHMEEIKDKGTSVRHFKLAMELQKEIVEKCNLKMPNHQPRVKLSKVRDVEETAKMEETPLKLDLTSGVNDSMASTDEVISSDSTFTPYSIKTEPTYDEDLDNNSAQISLETFESNLKIPEDVEINSVSASQDLTENSPEKVQLQAPNYSQNLSTGNYDCPACNKPFKSVFSVRRHYESLHLLKRFKCSICNVADFSQLAKMKRHKKICKGEVKKEAIKLEHAYYSKNSTTEMYHCKKCDKKCQTPLGITEHYESVHLKLRYPCDICKLTVFSSSGALAKHKKKCLETLEQRLARIQQRKQSNFVCKLCGKRFLSQKTLRIHRVYIHENVNGFPCEVCGKKFTRPHELKLHGEKFHLEKLFCCRFCNEKFTSYYRKKTHGQKCTVKSKVKSEPTQ